MILAKYAKISSFHCWYWCRLKKAQTWNKVSTPVIVRSIFFAGKRSWGDHFPPSLLSRREKSSQTSTNCHCSLVGPSKLRLSMHYCCPKLCISFQLGLVYSSRICVYFVYIIYHNLDSLIMLVDRFRTAQSRKRFIWGSMKINHHHCFIAHCTIALA